jgi:hypothetical protein
VVEADLVDGADGHVGIGVGGQEHALGVRLEDERLAQQLDAAHDRHALVDHEERDRVAATRQLADDLQRLRSRAGADDPVVGRVPRAQVALDCTKHGRVVVHRQDRRLGRHGAECMLPPMLWVIVGVLVLLWFLGLLLRAFGGLIHLLIIVALVIVIYRLVTNRRIF